jgi:hypothetical protein
MRLGLTNKLFLSFFRGKDLSISLIKICSIQSGISTDIWKLADNVTTLVKESPISPP